MTETSVTTDQAPAPMDADSIPVAAQCAAYDVDVSRVTVEVVR